MSRTRSALMLLAALMLAGCAEDPFVDHGISFLIEKPVDQVAKSGEVGICYSDSTPWAEVEELAAQSCGAHGFQASNAKIDRWQCRMVSPHRATFACYVPGMVDEKGRYINPTNKSAVAAWRKRTGGKPGQPAAPGAAAPGAAAPPPAAEAVQEAPGALINPADIAGKPPMPAWPLPLDGPPPAAPYPTGSDFNLSPTTWGQHFEE
ncbi:hypothetical protein [Magnetospirillum sp. UT-4]|uniref:hypothetical protein n=1 Tax=Magnetospirillum sp. UT-4 TaxID=2681467 RepID=UPI00138373D8|nr:hypothetical protein [Magnetospirillum sp. UT-4]CAA7623842.1 conserved exported hypothetical protein [Magnetospirillum sp. UT-4]